MSSHKQKYKNYLLGKEHNLTSFNLIKYGDAVIELLEEYSCSTKEELLKKEGEYMRGSGKCVNRCIAGRDAKQYVIDNHETILKNKSEWRKNNRERIREDKRKWRETHKENIRKSNQRYYENKKKKIPPVNEREGTEKIDD
jgi:hypothetical protein